MLRKIRVGVAAFFIIAITLLFLDYTGAVHKFLGWCANIQLFGARLAASALISVALLLATLLLGRIYCSIICPLGIFQDIVSRIRKKNRFSYKKHKRTFEILRYVILGVFAFSGIQVIVVLLEPYSAYGRMVSQILAPVYQQGNNILAHFAERMDSYAFYTVDIWLRSLTALIVAVSTTVIVGVFAIKSGRGYCNTVCPIGTLLSIFAKYSLVKLRIDKENCNNCGICAKNCKASCLDSDSCQIDYTRCVVCFNCIESCPRGAIKYSTRSRDAMPCVSISGDDAIPEDAGAGDARHCVSTGRRSIVSGILVFALGFFSRAFAAYQFDGGLMPLKKKTPPKRQNPIIPAGADNIRDFGRRCTSCQLCVSVCPNHVLRPSNIFSRFLQPEMSFERGYCRPECVKCSTVCPTGAIREITPAEKSATQIGYAIWRRELCVIITDNVTCDLCSHKCPVGAVTLISQTPDDNTSPKIPMVDPNRCIGCGACENLCPARPLSAIYVEGVEEHRLV
jgi:polyferredoxin